MLASRLGSFEELRVADLFAGTGALGLEALSRGAAFCTFVEKDRNALDILKRNVARLADPDRTKRNWQRSGLLYDPRATREWRNGRRSRLKIDRRKAWGFESPLSHQRPSGPPL